MFGTLGGPELFLIFVVALIVFGPRKLPDIGKSLGRMMAEFRRASNEFRSTIESEVEAEKIRESMRIETSPPAPAYGDEPKPDATGAGPDVSPAGQPAPPDPEGQKTPSAPGDAAGSSTAADVRPSDPEAREPARVPETVSREPETVSREPDPTPIEPK
jgi:Tat protein translocase TatB subunit